MRLPERRVAQAQLQQRLATAEPVVAKVASAWCGAAADDGSDCAPVDTPLPASAACATDPAVTVE